MIITVSYRHARILFATFLIAFMSAQALADPILCNPLMGVCSVGILPGRLVVIPPHDLSQHASEWCWAASTAMVFAYYGYDVPQEQIVNETFGRIENFPAGGPTLTHALNRDWTDRKGKRFHSSAASYDPTTASYQISPLNITNDLQANHPMIVGSGGHAFVLTAVNFRPGGAAVGGQALDPLYGFRSVGGPELWGASYTASIQVTPR
jgi:hypothetical protein